MTLILNIETSTEICSVSISDCSNTISSIIARNDESSGNKLPHAQFLAQNIDKLLKDNNNIEAVAVSAGPGSYTGLRIGVSTAKGICFARKIPLIAVDTLTIIAKMGQTMSDKDYDYIIPMIDARRMEVYTKIFDKNLNEVNKTEAKIIDENSYSNFNNNKILFCGNGAEKCAELLKHKNFTFIPNIYPSAEYMATISQYLFINKHFENLAYFEPFYLKNFVTTTAKNKFL